MKKAYFYFETSSQIGAGHAIRSCVLADALVQLGWHCKLITSQSSYEFIDLSRFQRIEPSTYFTSPSSCNLLVIDHYGTAFAQEHALRPFAERILVIDDLGDRRHDCDLLIDQTYGCSAAKYNNLVPNHCLLLTGSNYVLLRKEFTDRRFLSFKHHQNTPKPVEKLTISMGGGSAKNSILQALEELKEARFKGHIDIVLGFSACNTKEIEHQLHSMGNSFQLHVNPNIAELMHNSDLVFGAAGSGVWERCVLGIKQYLVKIAENQQEIISLFPQTSLIETLKKSSLSEHEKKLCFLIDGLGCARILNHLQEHYDKLGAYISHEKIKPTDVDLLFSWQQDPSVRLHSIQNQAPTLEEHKQWFSRQLNNYTSIFEKILCNGTPCGTLRLDYDLNDKHYLLSWYLISTYQNRGIGTLVLKFAKTLVQGRPIKAYVLKQNTGSHKAMINAGFEVKYVSAEGTEYITT